MDLQAVEQLYSRIRDSSGGFLSSSYVGFQQPAAQAIRFRQLVAIGVSDGDSVLDCGCGTADLWQYLLDQRLSCRYRGIDVSPAYIEASRAKYPGIDTVVGDVAHLDCEADWILASGLFSVGVDEASALRIVEQCYQRCRRGFAFNMLFRREQRAAPRRIAEYFAQANSLVTFDPERIESALRRQYPSVEMITGYLPDDFTVYLRQVGAGSTGEQVSEGVNP